ncbi:MAG: hypothetical protein A3A80_03370 [Candidatus Terrybacteria bacterium RIFCSPLOWO2_01_FULL_44_24]|uniref:Uncharacterized protein n=1 Tax=Candidatus Terrybacteria bacterium RIFCSPHIGHO2_01_FULL_43_35 TaxID=1802361 RepID=A0A1G2PDH6_9BACT|nr:MAG: hypothetical protein A2828_00285 [Candidatus Terrybacteria bacterium RIFCSPHIGHO2_01_FULL_43_35]OHA49726.1 MAG: hypothetical protein A3B75_01860 [Candidatus Terrybacteria bacterium RIFCSPHIGHO2_02_FULL_43_14]OHA51549.1 MAG: hypothetical protein A3A80_03370 [Candidatus Terrybacteria bacterium RIFCSPLOWO2_01_FULL_44_24]
MPRCFCSLFLVGFFKRRIIWILLNLKTKNLMKPKHVLYSLAVAAIAFFGTVQYTNAHQSMTDNSFMRQMMGQQTLYSMEQMEDQMMGDANHERMEELMDKLFAGTLSSEEQSEMTAMMQNQQTGAGAMLGMMGMMTSRMMQNAGIGNSSMMGFNYPMNVWGGTWLYSLLLFVWLVVGILAAIWLFKQILKKNQ